MKKDGEAMERLTIPDVRVDENTIRRTFVDAGAVRVRAMEFYWRLKAYEDKGLLPDEILPKEKADEIALKLMRLADLESICSYTRLRELAESDKDGRVVVLPCKVGDTVWMFSEDFGEVLPYTVDLISVVGKCLGYSANCSRNDELLDSIDFKGNDIGMDVFFTREEAENALEAMKDE